MRRVPDLLLLERCRRSLTYQHQMVARLSQPTFALHIVSSVISKPTHGGRSSLLSFFHLAMTSSRSGLLLPQLGHPSLVYLYFSNFFVVVHSFIWLHQVFISAHSIFSCSTPTLSYST